MKTTDAAIIFITGTLTLLVFVFFLVLIIIEYRRRQVRHVTEKLELKHQYQSAVLQTQLEVQEQSFKYVSEEIHDNVAQVLSLAKLKLYQVLSKTADDKLKAGATASMELVSNALNDLRNLSHVLNGGLVSKLSLTESIEKELNYVNGVKGVAVRLETMGAEQELDDEKKLMVFRIVQEAINNTLKHSGATEINISLEYKPRGLQVMIADNGKGFDTSKIDGSKGLGLHNMHVRAGLLGDININSEQDKGTVITLNIATDE